MAAMRAFSKGVLALPVGRIFVTQTGKLFSDEV